MRIKIMEPRCPECGTDTKSYDTTTCPNCNADKTPATCPHCQEQEVYTETKREPNHTKVFAVCHNKDGCIQRTLGTEYVDNPQDRATRSIAHIAYDLSN